VLAEARALLLPSRPQAVSLHADLTQSFLRFFVGLGLKAGSRVGAQRPYLPELYSSAKNLGLTLVPLAREPVGESMDFRTLNAVVLSNPHRPDGFFYPDEMYFDLYRKIRSSARELPILSEESLNLFSFNDVPPGSFASITGDAHLYIAGSLYPVHAPQGPELSWCYSRASEQVVEPHELDAQDLIQGTRAILAFHARQGAAVAEFQRRMLALERGLRIVADMFRRPIQEGRASVPLWPETGFHLMVDVSKQLSKGQSIKAWALGLAKERGILVTPGHLFGEPTQVQICYAASHSFLGKLAAKVEEIDRSELGRD
jgi:aspartate/methionine/tyrosine aminotransferase